MTNLEQSPQNYFRPLLYLRKVKIILTQRKKSRKSLSSPQKNFLCEYLDVSAVARANEVRGHICIAMFFGWGGGQNTNHMQMTSSETLKEEIFVGAKTL